MLRLLVEDRGTNDESARIARLGDYLETEGFKHIIEVNPDIWGTGETFQEARTELKERLKEHIEELQIFYENLESETPLIVDAQNQIIEDPQGTIWFDKEAMVHKTDDQSHIRFFIFDEFGKLLSNITVSQNSPIFDDIDESLTNVTLPLVNFEGRLMNVNDLPKVNDIDVSSLTYKTWLMLDGSIEVEDIISIEESVNVSGEILVIFTIRTIPEKPREILASEYRLWALPNRNGRYVSVDAFAQYYPREFTRYWEIIIGDCTYYETSRNIATVYDDAKFFMSVDGLDQNATINIREISASEYKMHIDEARHILKR